MIDFIYAILYLFVLVFSSFYIWHDLLNKDFKLKDKRLFVAVLITMLFIGTNVFITNKFLKIVLVILIFMVIIKVYFKESIRKSIVTSIFYEIIMFISEFVFAIFLVILDTNVFITLTSSLMNMLSNIMIAMISVIIFKIPLVKKLYNKLLSITDKVNLFQLLFLCIISMLVANILIMSVYYKLEFLYLLIFNISMISICFIIVFSLFRTKNNFNKVSSKYNIAIKSLKDYEDMITKYRISNHENKNLLLTIRAMVLNKEEKIDKYIDSIVKKKYNDDEKLFTKINSIPSGGLRGTIYSEILKIEDNNINYNLNIDSQLRAIDLIEIDTDIMVDICKIIGVFIDNSIDATKALKDGLIQISIYTIKNNIEIKISNNINSKVEVSNMYEEGYTTKGKDHGYGLTLVKQLIDNNKNLDNLVEINKDTISQILIIKK